MINPSQRGNVMIRPARPPADDRAEVFDLLLADDEVARLEEAARGGAVRLVGTGGQIMYAPLSCSRVQFKPPRVLLESTRLR